MIALGIPREGLGGAARPGADEEYDGGHDGHDGGDGMDGHDGQDGAGPHEDCLPVECLAMPDQNEQMQTPEVGDMVHYTVEGRVTRIEGDHAYIERESINGKPCDEHDGAESPDNSASEPGDEGAALRSEASDQGVMG